MLSKGCITACYTGIWLYTNEIYPTSVRSSSSCIAYIFTRIGSSLGAYAWYLVSTRNALLDYYCISLFVPFTVHDENKIIIITKLFTNTNNNSNYLTHRWAIKASTNSTLSNSSHCFVRSRISHNSLIVLHNAILLGSGGTVILLLT